MQHSRFRGHGLSSLAASCALALVLSLSLPAPGAYAADPAPANTGGGVRPEIGKIFNEAKDLAVQRKFPETLAKLQEADAIANHTPAEQGALETLRVIALLETNDIPGAIKSMELLPDTVTPEQRSRYYIKIAYYYFNAKDYPNAIEWAKRYLAVGGPESDRAQMLLGRGYYFTKDYANAIQSAVAAMEKDEAAGKVPDETVLEIIGDSALRIKDTDKYILALTKLTTYYPTNEHWDDLIHAVIDRPGFPMDKRALDIFRLEAATGAMTRPIEFNDYATLALGVGLPGEAKQALDKAPDAGKPTPLRAQMKKDYDADQKSLAKSEAEGQKAATGDILVKLGLDYYGYSEYDKAIALMQAGIAKGGLKSPDDANLNLGITYIAAGQKDKALETLKLVTKTGGPAELAQLWILKANSVGAAAK